MDVGGVKVQRANWLAQEQVGGDGQDTGWKCIHEEEEKEEGKEERNADCRGMISVLTLGTSITSTAATPTDPSPRLTYQSVPQGLKGEPSSLGTNHKT